MCRRQSVRLTATCHSRVQKGRGVCRWAPWLLRAHRAPQSRWRLALLITVLAGFFLMHGLSGADTCASVMPSLPSSAGSTAATAATSTMTGQAAVQQQTVPSDRCCAAAGALCVPLRPQEAGWLLLLGLAVCPESLAWTRLIAAALRAPVHHARGVHARGAPVRLLACVIRT